MLLNVTLTLTLTSGVAAFAMGGNSEALGEGAVAIGNDNISGGSVSHPKAMYAVGDMVMHARLGSHPKANPSSNPSSEPKPKHKGLGGMWI